MKRLYNRLHFKVTCLYFFFIFVTVYMLGSFYWIITQNHLSDETFLEANRCPACYGESMCYTLSQGNLFLTGLSKFRTFDFLNSKNVHFAQHFNQDTRLVVKKLASNRKLRDIDDRICSEAQEQPGCNVKEAIPKTKFVQESVMDDLFAKRLQGTSLMFACLSTRLLERLLLKYVEKTSPPKLVMRDKVQIWMASLVNAEPLILQSFPASEGWPFPEYHGACGRYVISGYGGRQLTDFCQSPWLKRVDISYQLMKIADFLSHNPSDFALYLADVTFDNFAVDAAGKVTVVDAEDIVVVDKEAITAAKPQGWADLHESTFSDCHGNKLKSCDSFSERQLCSHVTSDHNFYAMCRYILSHYAGDSDSSCPDGLLHDIPDVARNDWDLDYLLHECALPTRRRGRIQVVHKLIEALDSLRQNVTKQI